MPDADHSRETDRSPCDTVMPLRLIFMGTPDFAVPTLLELVAHGHDIAAVYTRAPKPGGGAAWSCSRRRSSARRGGSAFPC